MYLFSCRLGVGPRWLPDFDISPAMEVGCFRFWKTVYTALSKVGLRMFMLFGEKIGSGIASFDLATERMKQLRELGTMKPKQAHFSAQPPLGPVFWVIKHVFQTSRSNAWVWW